MGSLPFNETIKDLFSPSIDFSLSFSDKFELIIQCQPPGDVYFQHEGQIIHSAIRPTRSHSPLLHRLTLHMLHSFFPQPSRSWQVERRHQRAARRTSLHGAICLCSPRDFCPHVTSRVVLSAKRALINSKLSDGGGLSLLALRANVT